MEHFFNRFQLKTLSFQGLVAPNEFQVLLSFIVEDEEMYGDFEDLETGEVHKAKHKGDSESDDKGEESDDNQATKDNVEEIAFDRRLERKKKMKAAFDALYPLVLFYIFAKSFSGSSTCKAGGGLITRLALK